MPETTQSDLAERLRALDAAATPGPWAYRPDDMDDWGIVKSPPQPVEGFEGGLRCCLAQFRHPEALDEEVLNAHRRAKTDPWQGNAELVTFLRNAVPDILGMAAEISRLHAHCEALEKAMAPFLDLGPQRGAWGVISKKLGDFAPMTVTVTKAQMLEALTAYRKENHNA